jgi:hypothetical protein
LSLLGVVIRSYFKGLPMAQEDRPKDRKSRYRGFVARYLARGAVGVSVGLTAVASAAAKPSADASRGQASAGSFSLRLAAVRSAVSEHLAGERFTSGCLDEPLTVAQIIPHPPPPPQPFRNFFAKAPFQDAFRNVPQPPK